MQQFSNFLMNKDRQNTKKLRIIRKVLEGITNDFNVKTFLKDNEDPYVYVESSKKIPSTFKGIRIYSIGDKIAFRVQNNSETQPYGESYILAVEDVFQDIISEIDNQEKAGKKVMQYIIDEINAFFIKSIQAELKAPISDPLNMTVVNFNQRNY